LAEILRLIYYFDTVIPHSAADEAVNLFRFSCFAEKLVYRYTEYLGKLGQARNIGTAYLLLPFGYRLA
jgi:hypothetical protein